MVSILFVAGRQCRRPTTGRNNRLLLREFNRCDEFFDGGFAVVFTVEMRGDQWQLDARIVKWQGYLSTFGLKPAYRLERLSGRYYDIEQETTAKRTAHAVHDSLYGVDVWKIFHSNPEWVPVVDAAYGSATYLPMKDGALFEISLSNTGLLARPINDAARDAVAEFN